MARYAVYAIATASWLIAEVDAENEEEAIQLVNDTGDNNKCLCHQCASEIDIGDVYTEEVEKISD